VNKVKKMNKKEKQEFRRTLADKKDRIVRKLSEVISESKEVETNVAQDVVDKAESSYTKEFLLSLSDGEREQLMMIDEALRRLDKDDFGICQNCGKEVGKKRLANLPWAAYCIDCQQKIEEETGPA
jgi:DnaK suppressor protein